MIDPIPSTPVPRRRRLALWLGIGAGVLALCCAGTLVLGLVVGPPKKTASPARSATAAAPAVSSAAATSAQPPPTRAPSAAKPSPTATTNPDTRLCRLTTGGGTFYVSITSATAHRFDACAGGTDDPRTLDDLLLKSTDGMDRRCILGEDYTRAHQAIVGIYSSTKAADLAAARQFCRANGGTQ